VFLAFAGWAAHSAIDTAYRVAAAELSPAARVGFVDGTDPAAWAAAWHTADVAMSLPDNLQETFGLVVIEAMSRGLPVIGTDWNGYRDLIVDGDTGFLIPTLMVRGATAQATTRLVFGLVNYDHFLAECSQAAAVDSEAATAALARLVGDADLRRRMGDSGRRRVLERFTWEHVVRAYETLWAEQDREVRAWNPPQDRDSGPATFRAPEQSFASHPSAWLSDADLVRASAGADAALPRFVALALTNVVGDRRSRDLQVMGRLLRSAEEHRPIGDVAAELERTGLDAAQARATVAWLLKYGLLVTQ